MIYVDENFTPDYVVHPGEVLEEILEARKITNRDFSNRVGLTEKAISQIINGKALYSPETALNFEKVLDVKAEIWMNLADSFQIFVARSEEHKRLDTEETAAWVKNFPISDMRKLGILPKDRKPAILADNILRFLGASDPDSWDELADKKAVSFRKSARFTESPEANAVWLRLAEKAAEKIDTEPYNKKTFREVLDQLRTITRNPHECFVPEMKNLCASAGVAFVIVPELKATHLSGAARWLSPDKAMIALSLRYKTQDQFWFTFFHEAGHILLHGKKAIFLDSIKAVDGNQEKEADRFAANQLIPQGSYDAFIRTGVYYEDQVREAARSFSIHPGILVGRLQHEGYLKPEWQNKLKASTIGIPHD